MLAEGPLLSIIFGTEFRADSAFIERVSAAKAEHIDRELPCQEFQPPLNPILTVVEVVAADRVFSAEKRTADTPIDAMVDTNSTFVDCVAAVLARNEGTSGLSFVPKYNPSITREIPLARIYK